MKSVVGIPLLRPVRFDGELSWRLGYRRQRELELPGFRPREGANILYTSEDMTFEEMKEYEKKILKFLDNKNTSNWESLINNNIINDFSIKISNFNNDEMSDTIHGMNQKSFTNLIDKILNNNENYNEFKILDHVKKNHFPKFCKHILGITENTEIKETKRNIINFYLNHIPLFLCLNISKFILLIKKNLI